MNHLDLSIYCWRYNKTISELMIWKTNTEIAIELPRLKITCNSELKDVLKNMGLGSAFDGYADFLRMGNADENLVTSSGIHRTFLQVDEMRFWVPEILGGGEGVVTLYI